MTKGELGIWAYPAILMIYTIVGLFFAKKYKLTPKIKKRLRGAT
jgi:lipopolysaccharide export system permease protein